MNGIWQLGSSAAIGGSTGAGVERRGEGFGAVLKEAIGRVGQLEAASDTEIRRLLGGESDDLHQAVMAVQKSELAFLLLLETRNKVVQAYQEIMRIQV